jgi:hypothetical protein
LIDDRQTALRGTLSTVPEEKDYAAWRKAVELALPGRADDQVPEQ